MPSDKPDKVEKWRHPASAVTLLSQTAFIEKALENGLRVVEMGGYLYLAEETDEGHDMFRAYGPKWMNLLQVRRVATQANAGGGAIIIDVTCATGTAMRIVRAGMINSGTNGAVIRSYDEDNAVGNLYANVGSAASTSAWVPNIGAAATSSGNLTESFGLYIGPGEKLSFSQTGAGAQNDTATLIFNALLPITASVSSVTFSVARSTNPGDVTLAANTISATNEFQAVLLP